MANPYQKYLDAEMAQEPVQPSAEVKPKKVNPYQKYLDAEMAPEPAQSAKVNPYQKYLDIENSVAPERGIVGDTASSLARGAADTAELAGYALKTAGAEKAGQWVVDKTEKAKERFSIFKPDESEAQDGYVKKGVLSGVRSAVPSLTSGLGGATVGAGIGSAIAPGPGTLVGGAIGGVLGSLGLFGAGVYGKEKQRALDAGKTADEAHAHGFEQGIIEGGVEAIAAPLEFMVMLGSGGTGRAVTQPIKQTVKGLLRTPAKELLRRYVTNTGIEVGTEMFQSGAGNELAKQHGLQEGQTSDAMLDSIIPAITMSLMFGMGSHAYGANEKRKLQNNLSSPSATPEERANAANQVWGELKKQDKDLAEDWRIAAQDAINTNKPIDIDQNYAEFASQRQQRDSQQPNTSTPPISKALASLPIPRDIAAPTPTTGDFAPGFGETAQPNTFAPPAPRPNWTGQQVSTVPEQEIEAGLQAEESARYNQLRNSQTERQSFTGTEAPRVAESPYARPRSRQERQARAAMEAQYDNSYGLEGAPQVDYISDKAAEQFKTESLGRLQRKQWAAVNKKYQEQLDQDEQTITAPEIPAQVKRDARKQAEAIVSSDPVYQHMSEAKKRGGLDLNAFKEDYGVSSVSEIVRRYPGVFSRTGQVKPDEFAAEQGYESLDDMVQKFTYAKTKRELQAKVVRELHGQWQDAEATMQTDQSGRSAWAGRAKPEIKQPRASYPAAEQDIQDTIAAIQRYPESADEMIDHWSFSPAQKQRLVAAKNAGGQDDISVQLQQGSAAGNAGQSSSVPTATGGQGGQIQAVDEDRGSQAVNMAESLGSDIENNNRENPEIINPPAVDKTPISTIQRIDDQDLDEIVPKEISAIDINVKYGRAVANIVKAARNGKQTITYRQALEQAGIATGGQNDTIQQVGSDVPQGEQQTRDNARTSTSLGGIPAENGRNQSGGVPISAVGSENVGNNGRVSQPLGIDQQQPLDINTTAPSTVAEDQSRTPPPASDSRLIDTPAASSGAAIPPIPDSVQAGVASSAKQVHDYSNTQVNIKGEAAIKITEFGKRIPEAELYSDVNDDSYGREKEPHVTVRYGLATDDPTALKELSNIGPITAKIGRVSIFETDRYDVVKAEIESDSMRAANKKVGELVDVPGETFKDYQPHATIAYVKKGEGKKYIGNKSLEGTEITFDEINLTDRTGKTHPIKLAKTGQSNIQPSSDTKNTSKNDIKPGETRVDSQFSQPVTDRPAPTGAATGEPQAEVSAESRQLAAKTEQTEIPITNTQDVSVQKTGSVIDKTTKTATVDEKEVRYDLQDQADAANDNRQRPNGVQLPEVYVSDEGGAEDQTVVSSKNVKTATGPKSQTTLSAILSQAKDSTNPTTKQLAQLLSDFIPGSKLDTKVVIDPSIKSAKYTGKTNTITIKDPAAAETSLHEIVHAVTVNEMEASPEIKRRVTRLMNTVKRKAIAQGILSTQNIIDIEIAGGSRAFKNKFPAGSLSGVENIAYAFLNEKEFLAQAFSSPQFQGLLKNTKLTDQGKMKAAFDAFVELVMKALGIQNVNGNAFGEAVKLVAELASKEVAVVNEFAQGEEMSLDDAMGKIQNIEAFKKWFEGSIVTVDGKAGGEPLGINGFFVNSRKAPPKKPKGYKTGKKLREKILQERDIDGKDREAMLNTAWDASPDIVGPWTNPPSIYSDQSEQGEREFFLSGLYGLPEPKLVIGRRMGGVPEKGYSWNKASNEYEQGVSVVDVLSTDNQNKEYWQYDGLLGDRENLWVWGYRLDNDVFYGGDGEVLLARAEVLSAANSPNVKSIFNTKWNPANPDIMESYESPGFAEPPTIGKTKAEIAAEPRAFGLVREYFDKPDVKERFEKHASYLWDKDAAIARVQKEIGPQPEARDYNLLRRLTGKKVSDEISMFDRDKLKPLLKEMAEAKVKFDEVGELAWAEHAPERNLQMRRVNAKRYIDNLLQNMTEKEKEPFQVELGLIQDDFVMDKQTRNDRRDNYITLLNQMASDVISTEAQERQKVADAQAEYDARTFTQEEIDNETPARVQKRIDNASERLDQRLKTAEKWNDVKDRLSGMTDEESAEIIKSWKNDPRYSGIRPVIDKMREINEAALAMNYEAGELTKEEYEAIKNTYKFHVPLYREDMDGGKAPTGKVGVGPLASPIKIAAGSTKAVVDIFPHIIDRYQSAINRKHKLDAGRILYEMVKSNPDDSRWMLAEQEKKPYADNNGNIRFYTDQQLDPRYETKIKVDGKQYIVAVPKENKAMVRWMEALNREPVELGPIIKASQKLTRIMASLNTTASPEFLLTNFARDIQTAGIHLEDTDAKGMQAKVLKNIKAAIKGIYLEERQKDSGEWGKVYRDFSKNGAKISWMQGYENVAELAKNLESELAYAEGKKPKREKFRQFTQFVGALNTSVENGVRLATYKALIDSGVSPRKAAHTAANLTVDFTRHGTAGPVMNSLWMFANAGIQGNVRMFKAMKNPKVQKIAGGIVAFGFAANIIGAFAGGDDEDGEAYYDKLKRTNPSLFERNMVFIIPGTDGKHIKIPMPYGYNTLFVAGNELASALRGGPGYSAADGMARLTSALTGSFNPLGSATLLQTIMPTVLDPVAQVMENKAWNGQALMPESNPFGIDKPDSERYFKSVNPIAKFATQAINDLTGGSEVKSGLIDVSPETIEMLIETFTGSLGKLTKDTLSLPLLAASGDLEMHKVPFARKFVGSKSDYVDATVYRQNKDEIQLFAKEYEAAERYEKISMRSDNRFRMVYATKVTESQLRRLRKRRDAAKERGNDMMAERIDEQMKNIYSRYNLKYNANS